MKGEDTFNGIFVLLLVLIFVMLLGVKTPCATRRLKPFFSSGNGF
ncbi:MAG: hypothetical protein ACLU23_02830 [Eubacterium sp.]